MTILTNKVFIPEHGIEMDIDINSTVIHKGSSFNNYSVEAYYHNVIKPNLKDFYEDELNPKKVLNACITLYHLADWYAPENKTKKKELYSKIPFNEILESIANGTKHCNKKKKYQTVKKEGSYIPTKLIVNDGKNTYNLIEILKEIEKFWDSMLKFK